MPLQSRFCWKKKYESDKDGNKKQHKKHVGNETDTMQSGMDNIAANVSMLCTTQTLIILNFFLTKIGRIKYRIEV
jgi:hypothetical protein